MADALTKKVFISVDSEDSQQDCIKTSRKKFGVIQKDATDKENLVGRQRALMNSKLQLNSSTPNEKKKTLVHQHSQTQESGPSQNSTSVTELDLTTTDAPSEKYWQHLAEARRRALEDSLCENEKLHNRNRNLEEELNVTNEMLDQARGLVEVLKEMLEENEADQGLDQVQQADEEDEEAYEETLDHTPPSSIEKKEPVDTNDQDD